MGFSNSNGMIREGRTHGESDKDIFHVKEKQTSNAIFCFQIQCSFHCVFTDLGSISMNVSFHFLPSFLLSLLPPSLPSIFFLMHFKLLHICTRLKYIRDKAALQTSIECQNAKMSKSICQQLVKKRKRKTQGVPDKLPLIFLLQGMFPD